ncbi:diacylglycerol kinase family protein [Heyndrickxia sporothermodurans]
MNLDSKGKGRFIKSFYFAVHGILHAVKYEKNLQFHLLAAIVVFSLSIWLSVSRIEWMFIIVCIFGMFVLELLNTAIERMVDLASPKYHPLAKQAKDVAAAAVLCYSFMTIIIGSIIFLPKIIHMMAKYIS